MGFLDDMGDNIYDTVAQSVWDDREKQAQCEQIRDRRKQQEKTTKGPGVGAQFTSGVNKGMNEIQNLEQRFSNRRLPNTSHIQQSAGSEMQMGM